jgi:predicted unusual protein kinase regulating ubiquinone biosynthesis (AarF/ABC1/UbiB family)
MQEQMANKMEVKEPKTEIITGLASDEKLIAKATPGDPGTSQRINGKVLLPAAPQENQLELSAVEAPIGIKGYLRLLKILLSFCLFGLLLFINRRNWRLQKVEPDNQTLHSEGANLRDKLLALGPTFIKIGQTLATRADLLPIEYIQELSQLQDNVPSFPTPEARAIIEEELQAKIEAIFREFDDTPVAAASLGQVYRATLQTGQIVAVKVQRPNIVGQIDFDITVLRRIVRRLERYPNLIRGLDWNGTLNEFRTTIAAELDYSQEVRNAETFRKNFASWREVYVPRIFPIFSTNRLIVMEFIEGLKVTDIEPLEAAGHHPHEVVKLLARTYLKQLLEDGFFHADPHPGNLRVMADGRLAFFDFGMVGSLSMHMQSQLISAFFHIVERDVSGLVDDMIRLGFIELKKEEEEKFKPIIQGLFDRYLSLKLKEVNFKELTFDLAKVIYEFPFRIPANFTYIVRAIMTLEGIGTLVDPNFNFFEVARPYAKGFMFKREGRYLRELLIKQLRGEEGDIEWGKVWKLAKMAFKYYWRGEDKL